MADSLGKLQSIVTKQEKKIIKLQDKLAEVSEERDLLEFRLKQLEKNFDKAIEEKVNKAVNEAVNKVTKYYEKIIKEKDQRIFELENRLNINSSNSSLPSSKNPIYQSKICNSRGKTENKIGGQLGHKKHKLEKFKEEEITEIKEYKFDKCSNCGKSNLDLLNVKERDELDFEIKIIKRRHKFYEYKCPDCGEIIKTNIPIRLHADNQYGNSVKALACTLYNYGFVSFNRIRKIINGFTNEEIDPSEGFLAKLQKVASENLKDFVFDVKERLLKANVLHWDDTVIKIGEKDKACLRVYSDKKYVLYKAHIAKNTKGMDEDGILQNLTKETTVVHDHILHNYCDDYNYKNAECNAHITRKLESITQSTNHNWSQEMKKLLEITNNRRKEKLENNLEQFDEAELEEIMNNYDSIIEKGFVEYKEFKHKYEYENEENLLEFLRDFKDNITAWIKDFSIPYSNNLAESLLRMSKTKMKVSYQFKNLNYAEYFANINTYTETCYKFGKNKYEALKRLFDNDPYTIEELESTKNTQ